MPLFLGNEHSSERPATADPRGAPMSEPPDDRIRRLVELASHATKDVSDPELKKIAFQTVLAHLLESQQPAITSLSRTPRGSRRPTGTPTAGESEPRRVREGPSAWVSKLIHEDFFAKPRLIGDVVNRLGEVGHTLLSKDVSYPLAKFCDLRRLRRTKTGKDKKGKTVWSYTNY